MAKEVKTIRECHLKLLGRYPSSVEITYWLHFFAAGGTPDDLQRDLMQTHEFRATRQEARVAG